MRARTQLVYALAALLLVGAFGASVAVAGKTATRVTIDGVDYGGGTTATYAGHVKSRKDRCIEGRRITLIHDSDPPFTIGETKTDENGDWEITGNVPPKSNDNLIVKVAKKGKCRGDRSRYDFYDLSGATARS
jgi:hypothetical protein